MKQKLHQLTQTIQSYRSTYEANNEGHGGYLNAALVCNTLDNLKKQTTLGHFSKNINKCSWNFIALKSYNAVMQWLETIEFNDLNREKNFVAALNLFTAAGYGKFKYLSHSTSRATIRCYSAAELLESSDLKILPVNPAVFTAGIILACYNFTHHKEQGFDPDFFSNGPQIEQVVLNEKKYGFIEFRIIDK